jgi:oxygen-dependent protoporphyrinogen oxidase
VRISREGDWILELDDGSALHSSCLILAVPAHQASELLAEQTAELAHALQQISFVSTAVVFLGFQRDQIHHPLEALGFVSVPGSGHVNAATFVSTKWEGRAPRNHVLLRAFVGGVRDEDFVRAPDSEIEAIVLEELRTLLGITGEPYLRRCVHFDRATPQLKIGHQDLVSHIRSLEAREPGLLLAGSGYEGIGIPECIRQGRNAAERALAAIAHKAGFPSAHSSA